ncbi:MAG TPA: MarR family winged helix-turn-helix transcriptional regulator [Pirellulales bacterium]|jgi:DNA-binding MarR family transcriptional regulator
MSLFLALTRRLMAIDDSAADLPLRQLRVCMLLHESPRTMSWLSRELGVSLSAMTQIADRLERARLVKRHFEGGDRRVRSLQLTPRGLKIMRSREAARIDRAKRAIEQLPPDTRSNVLVTLETLRQACDGFETNNSGAEVAAVADAEASMVTPVEHRLNGHSQFHHSENAPSN